MKRSLWVRGAAIALVLVFSVWESIAATAGPVLPNPGDTGVSKQEQEKLGLKAMAEVYKQFPVLPDSSPETQYVRQLGKKLEGVIPAQYSWPYQFHVIPQSDINAFALPGGPIFVNVGTIKAAQNEAQLAGVLSHEMSHVYMQHSVKQMKKNTVPSILSGLGQVLGGMIGGVGGAIASMGGQMSGGLLSMKYSRADEAQADHVGAIIMYKAGYNPKAMANFFQQLEQQGGSPPQLLSDHPNPGNREQAIDQEIQNWPPRNYQTTSAAFEKAKQATKDVKTYTAQEIDSGAKSGQWARMNQQSGSIPKNLPVSQNSGSSEDQGAETGIASISDVSYSQVRPSGNFKSYQANGLSLSYPDNWQVYSDRQGNNGWTIAPAAGYSGGNIAYGVVINNGQDQNATTLDQAVNDLVQSMQQSNPDMRAIGKAQVITVNGVRGRSIDLQGNSPVTSNGQPERERDWLVMFPDVSRDNGFVYMIFVAPESNFQTLRPTYEKILQSAHLNGY
jgi:Zn-dependent protease with chaperone function